MKKIILALLISFNGYAQKQGNVWCFGTLSGINFNTGSPVVFTGAKTSSDISSFEVQEGSSSICDGNGKLLLYCGGKTIWSHNHQVMAGGSGINGGTSSTQAALIVPKPGSDSIFYSFTSDEFQSYTSPPLKGYRYSLVDMCNNSGNGQVYTNQKNVLLEDSATEKLAACRDGAGTGYWVVGHKMFSNQFISWHLTTGGVTSTVVSNLGTLHGWYPQNSQWGAGPAQGQMKISPSGNKLALVCGNIQPGFVDIFDFNSTTGVVSNSCHIVIDSADLKNCYGVEFSPDGSKLYYGLNGGSGKERLYQLDLSAGNCSAVKSSAFKVFQATQGKAIYGMQLGPDNKIYIVYKGNGNLAGIHLPNLSGAACNFDSAAVNNPSLNTFYTLPSYVAGYNYHNDVASCCTNQYLQIVSNQSILCTGQQAVLTASTNTGALSYTWFPGGASTSSILINPPVGTTYTLVATYSVGCIKTAVFWQDVWPCTSLENNFDPGDFIKIYPNPSAGSFYINSAFPILKIEIYDLQGRLVLDHKNPTKQDEIMIEKQGVYFVKYFSTEGNGVKKVIVIKQ